MNKVELNKKELEYQRKIADRYPELIAKKAAYAENTETGSHTEMSEHVRNLYNIIEPCMVNNHMPLEYLDRACELVRGVFNSEAILPKKDESKEVFCNE